MDIPNPPPSPNIKFIIVKTPKILLIFLQFIKDPWEDFWQIIFWVQGDFEVVLKESKSQ